MARSREKMKTMALERGGTARFDLRESSNRASGNCILDREAVGLRVELAAG